MDNTATKKPIKVISCGTIKAAIWCDSRVVDNTMVDLHSIKIDKSYKDGQEWKNTNIFNVDDLPKVAALVMEVYKLLRIRTFENSVQGDCNELQDNKV